MSYNTYQSKQVSVARFRLHNRLHFETARLWVDSVRSENESSQPRCEKENLGCT